MQQRHNQRKTTCALESNLFHLHSSLATVKTNLQHFQREKLIADFCKVLLRGTCSHCHPVAHAEAQHLVCCLVNNFSFIVEAPVKNTRRRRYRSAHEIVWLVLIDV
jgi:hypothetical protein